jgi:hypothetical protein
MSSRRRRRWICVGCGMSARHIDGLPMALPASWGTSSDEGPLCLLCRRERAAQAAVIAAGEEGNENRAEIRKTALIEFEVRRTPQLSNGAIARACQCAPLAVAAARERLCLPEPSVLAPQRRRGPAAARPRDKTTVAA